MLLKPLAFAAAAAALLLVPEAPKAGEGIFKALPVHAEPFELPESAFSQSMTLHCRQCKGRNSQLQLDLEVEEGSRLMLNGFELYPNADPWNDDLSAIVTKANGEEKRQRLGYGLAVKPGAIDADMQLQIVDVELTIIEVGGRFVNGIPTVKAQLVQSASGEIFIGGVAIREMDSMAGCTSMRCRVKEWVGKMLKGFKCAGSRHRGGHGPDSKVGAEEHHRDGGDGHHKHKGHGHHRHNWHKLVKNVAAHIFLPVLMGITAGVSVALFAMVICSAAVRLTRFARDARSGSRCCLKKQSSQTSAEQGTDIEKVGLMEEMHDDTHEEAPPQYQDDDAPKN